MEILIARATNLSMCCAESRNEQIGVFPEPSRNDSEAISGNHPCCNYRFFMLLCIQSRR